MESRLLLSVVLFAVFLTTSKYALNENLRLRQISRSVLKAVARPVLIVVQVREVKARCGLGTCYSAALMLK